MPDNKFAAAFAAVEFVIKEGEEQAGYKSNQKLLNSMAWKNFLVHGKANMRDGIRARYEIAQYTRMPAQLNYACLQQNAVSVFIPNPAPANVLIQKPERKPKLAYPEFASLEQKVLKTFSESDLAKVGVAEQVIHSYMIHAENAKQDKKAVFFFNEDNVIIAGNRRLAKFAKKGAYKFNEIFDFSLSRVTAVIPLLAEYEIVSRASDCPWTITAYGMIPAANGKLVPVKVQERHEIDESGRLLGGYVAVSRRPLGIKKELNSIYRGVVDVCKEFGGNKEITLGMAEGFCGKLFGAGLIGETNESDTPRTSLLDFRGIEHISDEAKEYLVNAVRYMYWNSSTGKLKPKLPDWQHGFAALLNDKGLEGACTYTPQELEQQKSGKKAESRVPEFVYSF